MVGPSDLRDHRVDLDRVDVTGAAVERLGDVGARPGPDNQDAVKGPPGKPLIRLFVDRLLARVVVAPQRLVRDTVHEERFQLRPDELGDPVIRRPDVPATESGRGDRQEEDAGHGDPARCRPAGQAPSKADHEQAHAKDGEPDGRRRPGGGQHREQGDPDERANDVEAVGAQRRH